MDAIIFGGGFKRTLLGMVLYVTLVVASVQLVGYLKSTASPDQMALGGLALGALSIGGIFALLVRELRGSASTTDWNDQ